MTVPPAIHPLLLQTDKHFWHRFTPVYEAELHTITPVSRILEFGVFHGNSIRWLAEKYPDAEIFGCDILPVQPDWPRSDAIGYFRVNQESPQQLRDTFAQIGGALDVIIEDGSHQPIHQKNCLVEGVRHLRRGGVYILEDIHTSHPEHTKYRVGGVGGVAYVGPLQLLLALEHLKSTDATLDDETVCRLTRDSLFSEDEVRQLFDTLDAIRIFKRATLPLRCYRCGRTDYEYATLRCLCGADIYAAADSMTAILRVVP